MGKITNNLDNKKQKFCLKNDAGFSVGFSNYGARITTVRFNGKELARNGYISGRCANRIAGASFKLNGKTYRLDQNERDNHLHGGRLGFSKKYWRMIEQTDTSISFFLHSPDGDLGYPGNLDIIVTYSLFLDGTLLIEFKGKCDQDTILNPINHLFLKNIDHKAKLWIDADSYTEKNDNNVPTGKIVPVTNTIYDFSKENYLNPKLAYDINYVLNGEGYRKVASLGNIVDLYTDRPGLQLYKSEKHVCLEAQIFPDAIHFAHFPSPMLKKDAAFYSKTAFHFKLK